MLADSTSSSMNTFLYSGSADMPVTKIPGKDRMFAWIVDNSPACKYNLSLSALPFPDLVEAGIETSVEEFRRNTDAVYGDYRRSVSKFFGVDEINVLAVGSGSQAIYIAASFLGSITSGIGVPDTEYEPIMEVPEYLGFDVNHFDSGSGPGREDHAAMCSAPNNPLGIMPEWLVSGNRSGKRVFADETFLPFKSGFRTLFSSDRSYICSGTTTKYFGLGDFKAGWFLADREDIEPLSAIIDHVAPGISRYSLWISSQALGSTGYFRKRSERVMERNLKIADDFVEEVKSLSWVKPDSAPFGFVHFGGRGSEELCRRILKKTGILLVPGAFMGDDSGFRLCFTSDEGELEESLDILRKFFG